MGATVSIVLDATDRASKKLDAFNNRIASMQAPIRNASRSLSRFFSVSGVSGLRKGMQDLSRSTLNTFRSVGRLVPEMGTLTGAASIAGVYKLASAWAQVGTNLRTSARSMGMAPGRLMALRNAARLSGGSADAMSGALGQLSTQKWEAINGFAPEAAAQFQALGISMGELEKLSPEQLFDRIANKIRGIKDPAAQSIAALKLFGEAGQGLLPVFQQTAQEYQQNIRLAERYGVMNQKGADAAARMQNSQRQLSLAVEGFGYSVAEAVEPAITPVLQQMAEWIAANRQWISQDIAGYVRQLVTWLKNGGWDEIKTKVTAVFQTISSVVDKLGGWKSVAKDVAIGMAVLWTASALAGLASLTASLLGIVAAMKSIASTGGAAGGAIGGIARSGASIRTALTLLEAYKTLSDASQNGVTPDQQKANREWFSNLPGMKTLAAPYAWAYRQIYGQDPDDLVSSEEDNQRGSALMKTLRGNGGLGLNESAIKGVTAAGIAESHLSPGAKNPFSSARGAYQFIRSTRDQILAEQGVDVWRSDVNGQTLAALRYYRQHNPDQFAQFSHASSPEEAMRMFTRDFLRPGTGEDGDLTRGAAFLRGYHEAPSAPAASVPSPAGQGNSGDLDGTISRLRVEISHDNAPPGSSVKVTSASSNLKVASITQQRAMDPTNTALGN